MNPYRQWLKQMVKLTRTLANGREFQRDCIEGLFLLGIQIGRGRLLTTEEKQIYRRTVPVARLVLCTEKNAKLTSHGNQQIIRREMRNIILNWLEKEAELRPVIEETMGIQVDEIPLTFPFSESARLRLKNTAMNRAQISGKL